MIGKRKLLFGLYSITGLFLLAGIGAIDNTTFQYCFIPTLLGIGCGMTAENYFNSKVEK
jgi:hypothetical protein